jgi:hypothetical protein
MEIESERAWNQLFSSIKHSRESALSTPIKPSMAQASVRGACGFVLANHPYRTLMVSSRNEFLISARRDRMASERYWIMEEGAAPLKAEHVCHQGSPGRSPCPSMTRRTRQGGTTNLSHSLAPQPTFLPNRGYAAGFNNFVHVECGLFVIVVVPDLPGVAAGCD